MSLISSFHQLVNELKSDIECAREWLLPDREVKPIEIKNCVNELDNIIKSLNSISKPEVSEELEFKERTLDGLSEWAYNLGIKLDNYIPLFGMDNFDRIEKAVKEFILMKKKESNKKQLILELNDIMRNKTSEVATIPTKILEKIFFVLSE